MFEQLQRLYPQAQAVAPDAVLPGYLIVQLGDQGLAIPQADLTSKEEELLLMMSLAKATPQVPVVDLAPHQQAWRAFLLEGQPLEGQMRGSLVCMYLIMQAKSETFDPVLWQQTLEDSLEAIEVVIPDEANRWLVCLRGMEHVGALVDIIKTLDIDFETVTRGCVGLVAKLDQDYVAHFQDEASGSQYFVSDYGARNCALDLSPLTPGRARGDQAVCLYGSTARCPQAQSRLCGDGASPL